MSDHTIYYDAILELTNSFSTCEQPENVGEIAAKSVKKAYSSKGCSVFFVDRETKELGLVASEGLSDHFLNKGPVHFMQEIREAKDAVPVVVMDVSKDPRLEYPEELKKEGIQSFLGVPIVIHNEIIGAVRIYFDKKWDLQQNDISMAQAMATICGMALEMSWMCIDHKRDLAECKEQNQRGGDTFGLGRPQNMRQLLNFVRSSKGKY